MAGLLDLIFGPQFGGMPPFVPESPDTAGEAAAGRVRRAVRRPVALEPDVPAAGGAPWGGLGLGLLGDLAGLGGTPRGGFDALDAGAAPIDDAAAADEARGAAAARVAHSVRRANRWPDQAPIPAVGEVASLLTTGGNGGAVPELPPATNDPASAEPRVFDGGDVPLPRPRPKMPSDTATDQPAPLSMSPEASNANAQGQRQPVPREVPPFGITQRPGFSFGSLFKPENAPLLLALGQMAGAPSFGTGLRRASAAAVAPAQLLRKEQLQQSTQAETYRALVARGVSPQDAIAAVRDPNIMKAVAAKYFETKPRTAQKIGVDMLGNDVMGSFDPNTGKFYDAAGREVAAQGGGGSSTSSIGGMKVLAEGRTEYDPALPADEYLGQFSPDVQAAIKNYIRGDTMPTSNPRLKGLNQKVKDWAQVYGEKTGIPVSDAEFAARRKYKTEIASNSANTAGGQAKAFSQGISHMGALADTIVKYAPSDAMGIPTAARTVNWVREAFSTKQADLAKQVNAIGQTLSGEVGKLFSGAAGGGVHERELTRKRFDSINSAPELAGALEATLETMEGGLRALEARRDQVMGPNSGIEFVSEDTKKTIEHVRGIIKQLRGDGGAAAPTAAPKPGNYVYDPTTKRLVPAQ